MPAGTLGPGVALNPAMVPTRARPKTLPRPSDHEIGRGGSAPHGTGPRDRLPHPASPRREAALLLSLSAWLVASPARADPPSDRAPLARHALSRVGRPASPLHVAGWLMAGAGAALAIAGAVQWRHAASHRAEGPGAADDASVEARAWARYAGELGSRDREVVCATARAGGGPGNDASRVASLCDTQGAAQTTAWVFTLAGLGLAGGGALMALLGLDDTSATRPRLAVDWLSNPRWVRLTVPFQ